LGWLAYMRGGLIIGGFAACLSGKNPDLGVLGRPITFVWTRFFVNLRWR
jgi:hypothetical protein